MKGSEDSRGKKRSYCEGREREDATYVSSEISLARYCINDECIRGPRKRCVYVCGVCVCTAVHTHVNRNASVIILWPRVRSVCTSNFSTATEKDPPAQRPECSNPERDVSLCTR